MMVSDGSISRMFLQWLIYSGPLLAAYVIGIAMASTQLTRYPKPARLALVGCLLHATASCTFLLVHIVLFEWGGWLGSQITNVRNTLTMSGVLLHVLGFALLFIAVFVGRRTPQPPAVELS